MAKRITPEDQVVTFFQTQPIVIVNSMFNTVKTIVKNRIAADLAATAPALPVKPTIKKAVRKPRAQKTVTVPPATSSAEASAPWTA